MAIRIPPLRIGSLEILPVPLAATLVLGAIGGAIAVALHLPLAVLLGSLVAVALFALAGWRPFGQPVHLPQRLRMAFIPVIGVAIGGAFTPQVLAQMPGWLPSLAAVFFYVPLVHFIGYRIYRRGGVSPVTAFFGAVPGGLAETVAMGEDAGGDAGMLVLFQFLRLIVTIIAVPIGFLLLTGHAVGSGSGAQGAATGALGLVDVVLLVVAGVVGHYVAHLLRFPVALLTGPLFGSAFVHLMGWTTGVPPLWAIWMTQLVMGAGLGARFAGMTGAALRRGALLALGATSCSLLVAVAFAAALHYSVGTPPWAAFLAFAPGGITEMSLIALSLQISAVYVTAHHLLRIVLSVALARMLERHVK